MRRSERIHEKTIDNEKAQEVLDLIRSGMDRGVSEIQTGSSLGRGVIASRDFENGEFVVEYAGHYVHSKDEFTNRMNEHDKAGRSGSFVFWFRHQESWHWYVMMFYAFFHLYFFKF